MSKRIMAIIMLLTLLLSVGQQGYGESTSEEQHISLYNKWKQAQNMEEEGYIYDDITNSLGEIKDIYDKGLVGTKKFRAAIELMTGLDTSEMTADELIDNYDKTYPMIKKFFKDGTSGLINFLEAVEKAGKEEGQDWAHKTKGDGWEIDIDIDRCAAKLGISDELVIAILHKFRDYGWNLDIQ